MIIQLKDIRINKLNPNVMSLEIREKLKENINKNGGFCPPLIIRNIKSPPSEFDKENTIGEISGFRLIDGHNRKIVLDELGKKETECVVLDSITDEQEMFLLANINELKGTQDFSKRAFLLEKIIESGISKDIILRFIPENERRLDFILSIALGKSESIIDNIQNQRNAIIERFVNEGFDSKGAEAMADVYSYKDYVPKAKSDIEGKKIGMRQLLIFFFGNEEDYNLAKTYFEADNNKEPKTEKLIELIKNDKKE
jgi:hypothetical protein